MSRKSINGMLPDLDDAIDYLEYGEPEERGESVPVRVIPKRESETVPVRAHNRKKAGRKSRKNTKTSQEPEMVMMEGRMVRVHTLMISILVTAIAVAVATAIMTWQFAESQHARVDAARGVSQANVVEGQE